MDGKGKKRKGNTRAQYVSWFSNRSFHDFFLHKVPNKKTSDNRRKISDGFRFYFLIFSFLTSLKIDVY